MTDLEKLIVIEEANAALIYMTTKLKFKRAYLTYGHLLEYPDWLKEHEKLDEAEANVNKLIKLMRLTEQLKKEVAPSLCDICQEDKRAQQKKKWAGVYQRTSPN